ncbi:MAG: NTP transferase domain-containing protein [Clostridia bacterium]|jgi:bifunctional UDP-N-acetylglucosamine pyrophosphorylase/glucosamine-1-phosphate N-acetyltransferase|nr:NTP transferase domain-containing protein [Clostridia bacterium]
MNKVKAIVLAGGKGTRMKSNLPKVLHKVYDRCIIDYVCDACEDADIDDIYVIVGHKHEDVEAHLASRDNVTCIFQEQQLGTGHAAMQAKDYINDDDLVLIVNGDMPLVSPYTITSFISFLEMGNYDGALVSAVFEQTPAYGRIVRDRQGNLSKIVEQKDCTEDELAIKEVNIGLYCFKGKHLKETFAKLDNKNAQNEYYITDVPYYIIEKGGRIGVYALQNPDEAQGVNSRNDLSIVTKTLLRDNRIKHMDNGVTLIDPDNTYISLDVSIGKDTIIYPGTNIQGETIIGENCIIGPNSTIISSTIGDNTIIESSKLDRASVGSNCVVGPYTYVTKNTYIKDNASLSSLREINNN